MSDTESMTPESDIAEMRLAHTTNSEAYVGMVAKCEMVDMELSRNQIKDENERLRSVNAEFAGRIGELEAMIEQREYIIKEMIYGHNELEYAAGGSWDSDDTSIIDRAIKAYEALSIPPAIEREKV